MHIKRWTICLVGGQQEQEKFEIHFRVEDTKLQPHFGGRLRWRASRQYWFFVFLFYQAYHKKVDMCFSFAWLREEHQDAQHIARHVFSLSGSFIDLEPVLGTLPCDQTQTIRTHYILKVPATGELKELIFYYLVRMKP